MGSNSSRSGRKSPNAPPKDVQRNPQDKVQPNDPPSAHPVHSLEDASPDSVDHAAGSECYYTSSLGQWLDTLVVDQSNAVVDKDGISKDIAAFFLKQSFQSITKSCEDIKKILGPPQKSPITRYGMIDKIFDASNPAFSELIQLCQDYIEGCGKSSRQDAQSVFMQRNSGKMRFSDILPYKYNHISMMGSWISQSIGAIQWPLPENLPDLYQELSTQNVTSVISLGPVVDTVYWDPVQVQRYNKSEAARISLQSAFQSPAGNRNLKQGCMSIDGGHAIHLIRYADWEDYEAPKQDALDAVIHLAALLRYSDSTHKSFVHCRAGVGRTGTLILIAHCWKEWEEKGMFDVIFELFKLRLRRVSMVQQQSQLAYVYTAMLHITTKGIKLADFANIKHV